MIKTLYESSSNTHRGASSIFGFVNSPVFRHNGDVVFIRGGRLWAYQGRVGRYGPILGCKEHEGVEQVVMGKGCYDDMFVILTRQRTGSILDRLDAIAVVHGTTGRVQTRISPCRDHTCRAIHNICVDGNTHEIYAGVSVDTAVSTIVVYSWEGERLRQIELQNVACLSLLIRVAFSDRLNQLFVMLPTWLDGIHVYSPDGKLVSTISIDAISGHGRMICQRECFDDTRGVFIVASRERESITAYKWNGFKGRPDGVFGSGKKSTRPILENVQAIDVSLDGQCIVAVDNGSRRLRMLSGLRHAQLPFLCCLFASSASSSKQ